MIRAIYGKVKLNRYECPNCGNHLLNKDTYFLCDVCGYKNISNELEGYKIIVPPPGIRNCPPKKIQEQLLKIQNYKCYWCQRKFDTPYWRNGKIYYLKINWDHKIPFSYEQTNRDDNWASSCNICNSFKYNFLFKRKKDCRAFLIRKWSKYLKEKIIEFADEDDQSDITKTECNYNLPNSTIFKNKSIKKLNSMIQLSLFSENNNE